MRNMICFAVLLGFLLCLTISATAQDKKSKKYAKASDFTVAIDAGHSYTTAGKRSAPFTREVTHKFRKQTVTVQKGEQFREHIANAAIAAQLEKILRKIGFKTVKVAWNDGNGRDDEAEVSLADRQATIRNAGATISISCHYNAIGTGAEFNNTGGVLTYIHSDPNLVRDSRALAQCLQNHLVSLYGQKDRGTPPDRLALCNCGATGCRASVIVEHAFMTCEQEAIDYFCNPEAWYNYAVANARGICDYLNVKYTGPKPTKQASKAKKGPTMGSGEPAKMKPISGELLLTEAGQTGVNVRTGPGSSYPVSQVIKDGSYSVVGISEDGKWYKLLSGLYITSSPTYVKFIEKK